MILSAEVGSALWSRASLGDGQLARGSPLVDGPVSRPSAKKWTNECGTPAACAASSRANRCRMWLCTPPSETRPKKCRRPFLALAFAKASSTALDLRIEPVWTARSMRTMSCDRQTVHLRGRALPRPIRVSTPPVCATARKAVDGRLVHHLVDDTASADVEVAHLAVAHQAIGQADGQAVGCQRRVLRPSSAGPTGGTARCNRWRGSLV